MNNLTVGIGADISNLQAGIASATSSISGFVSGANSRLQSLGDSFSNVGQKLSIGLSIPLGLLGKQALENGAGLESLKMGLKSIEEQQYGAGKSAEYAASRFSEFIEIAKLPGIGLKEAISMSIGLRSVGFSADEAKREILTFGNTLALVGKGKNELNGVALQLQQLSGKSSGFGADLRIIKEYAPQVGAALLQAFGTLDTESIAKTGVTGKQVIEKITTELEKLPKAGAGLKTAMENVSDSIFIATGRIGEALNKSLGLTSVFDSIGNAVGTLADYFTSLSPEVQKFIGITAGVLVVAPPVLAAIGAIVGAIGAMLSPVVLIGSGIIALTAIVASNWQAITGYLKETGVWDGLVSLVTNTFDMVTSIFRLATGAIIGIFSYFGEVLEKDTFGIFSTISGIIGSAFEVIGGITKTIAGIMSGDWSKMGDGLINIATGSFQAIMTITEGFMLFFLGIFKKPFEWVGMDSVVKTFESGATSLKTQFQGFRTELNKLGNDVEEKSKEITKNLININSAFGKLVVDNLASSNLGNVLNTGYLFKNEATVEGGLDKKTKTNTGETDESELKKAQKAREDFFKNTQQLLSQALKIENSLISDKYTRELKTEKQTYDEKVKIANQEKASTASKHRVLEALEKEYQSNISKIISDEMKGRSATEADGGLQGKGTKTLSSGLNIPNPLAGLTDKLNKSLTSVLGRFDSFAGQLAPKVQKMKAIFEGVNTGIQSSLQGAAASAFSGLGNIFGAMIAGTAGIGDAGKAIMGVIGNVFGEMGTQFSQAGVALLLLEPLIKNPFTSGVGMIAAGVALSALSGAISSTVSSGGTSGGGGSSYAQNYSSGSGSYGGGSQFNGGGERNQVFTINLTGKLTADGNDLSANLDRTIRQKARTYGGN